MLLTQRSPLLYWLAALRLPGIGPAGLNQWLQAFGNLNSLFAATETELASIGFKPTQIAAIRTPDWEKAEADLIWCETHACHIVTIQDEHYPVYLKETHAPPVVLFVQGELALLKQPQMAIVGSRNPTPVGKEIAAQFASQLTQAGLVVTSGLALGIDTESHLGALSQGKTIAVLGTGFKTIYPASNKSLAEKIKTQGALVTEFLPDARAQASHFPRRNRVISGLSLGVLVVEAALKSGSLITARYANEQGRDVFAIPGSTRQPLSRGCHQLIRQGAVLVESVDDILSELAGRITLDSFIKEPVSSKTTPLLSKELRAFLTQINYEVSTFDAIMLRSGLTAGEVSSMLLTLELQGCIKSVQGGYQLK